MNSFPDMADFLVTLRQEFLVEATFLLDQCEESFLKLEDPAQRKEQLAHIFRVAHTIKGSGAAVGFTDLAEFAHLVEDCLSLLRTSPERLTTDMVTLLLQSGDAIKARIESLQMNDGAPWQTAALVDELRGLAERLRGAPGLATPAEPPGFEIFDEPPSAATAATAPQIDLADDAAWVRPMPQMSSAVAAPTNTLAPAAGAPTTSGERTATTEAPPSGNPGAKKAGTPASVKIDVERIDGVLDLIGELVVTKSQLVNQTTTYGADLQLGAVVSQLDKIVRELQDKALGMRMTPLKPLFLKLQRLVRDIALKLGKPVELNIEGEDTEIDRTTVELLADPLMHIMRNAIDHGIEKPGQRLAAGKPERARITLAARQVGSRVVVSVCDDGAGIQRDRVLNKAVERHIVSQEAATAMSDREVYNLIFAPGFSTAESVTDLSGRGVGLDVVRTNMQLLKGTVDVTSTPGSGSVFHLSTPLTASITDGIVARAGTTLYVLPIDGVRELIKSQLTDLTELSTGQKILKVRDHLVPLVTLGAGTAEAGGMVMLVESGNLAVGLRVDEVLGQAQVVLKPVPESLGQLSGVGGVAVMGDGRVAIVVDIDGLLRSHQSGQPSTKAATPAAVKVAA